MCRWSDFQRYWEYADIAGFVTEGTLDYSGKKKIMFSDEMKNWKRKSRHLTSDIQMLCFFLLLGHFHI